jgi:hypothetical protein
VTCAGQLRLTQATHSGEEHLRRMPTFGSIEYRSQNTRKIA